MNKVPLSRLEEVDLRQVWDDEAEDFTPWLAQEENLALLGETIGLELELEGTEQSVGPFRADILCHDTTTDELVLIENQLERTDHKHLGQVFTYGAGLNAVTIVWIASCFTDEHRAALDWLNEITHEDINFFGLEIEVWRIGDSAYAPKFNTVSKPNEWSKTVAARATRTEAENMQLEYWGQFRELLLKMSTIIKPASAPAGSWMRFAIGRSGFSLTTATSTRPNHIRVELVLRGPNAKPHFYLLEQQKNEIERESGQPLEWQEKPNQIKSIIALRKDNADPTDRSQWPEQHQWLLENLETFHKVFASKVKTLDASEYVDEDEMNDE